MLRQMRGELQHYAALFQSQQQQLFATRCTCGTEGACYCDIMPWRVGWWGFNLREFCVSAPRGLACWTEMDYIMTIFHRTRVWLSLIQRPTKGMWTILLLQWTNIHSSKTQKKTCCVHKYKTHNTSLHISREDRVAGEEISPGRALCVSNQSVIGEPSHQSVTWTFRSL